MQEDKFALPQCRLALHKLCFTPLEVRSTPTQLPIDGRQSVVQDARDQGGRRVTLDEGVPEMLGLAGAARGDNRHRNGVG